MLAILQHTKTNKFHIFAFDLENVGQGHGVEKRDYAVRSQMFICVSRMFFS